MTDHASQAKPLPTPETHPLIFRLAREVGTPISFFDLETTGLGHRLPSFGITEFAFLAVMPNGQAHAHSKLLNPENPIEDRAREVTGIDNAMVAGAPNFGVHADKILRMMEKSLMVGFNCDSFDTPALLGQIDRYQAPRPAEWKSVDLYKVWKDVQNTKRGKQTEVAEHYGVPFTNAHRALADCSALADILEQMLWRHGTTPFHKAMKLNWDGQSIETPSAERSSTRAPKNGELTANQTLLKASIDELLPQRLSIDQFAASLFERGFKIQITKGGAAYIHGDGTDQAERIGGSVFGKGYAWNDVRGQLSGDIPQHLFAPGPVYGKDRPASAPADRENRQADEARAREILMAQARDDGRIDAAKAAAESGIKPSTVSFAISALLAEGKINPEHARDAQAQAWLDEQWKDLPHQGKLTPLLEACRKAGAPESVDFTQLRVAIATRKASMPSSARAAGPTGAPQAQPQGRVAAPSKPMHHYGQAPEQPAAKAPAYDEPPPFDDFPPFDAEPSASRMNP